MAFQCWECQSRSTESNTSSVTEEAGKIAASKASAKEKEIWTSTETETAIESTSVVETTSARKSEYKAT